MPASCTPGLAALLGQPVQNLTSHGTQEHELVLDQPRMELAERDGGTPVMIVSTELDEVLELADRIAVLYGGNLMGIVPGKTSRDVLGLMMAGMSAEEALSHQSETEGGAQ